MKRRIGAALAWTVCVMLAQGMSGAETRGPERFTATAIVNNIDATGAGIVLLDVNRWSSETQRQSLVETLVEKGPGQLLLELKKAKSVGTIRTPDTLAYDLRYAHESPGADGGRRIVLATDRPIGFWEAANQPRTLDYPFTVVQMEIGANGKGTGTLSYATKIRAYRDTIELENYSNLPIMLTAVTAEEK